jgi:hypothetical protein
MHLERRITALEGRSRNILLRLHDKIVGYCTVFGTVVGIGPAIADYFGQVDWKSFGLAPLTALALGALIVGFRAITSTPLGSRKAWSWPAPSSSRCRPALRHPGRRGC